MKWFFKLFEINERLESFKIPALKIAGCVIIMLAVCLFMLLVEIPPSALTVVLTIVSVLIIGVSVIVMFTAMAECLQVSQNIKNRRDREGRK